MYVVLTCVIKSTFLTSFILVKNMSETNARGLLVVVLGIIGAERAEALDEVYVL